VNSAHDILKRYWGYDRFRPKQEEIIQSIVSGKDTLALLPTGGGKSICFQVPALMMEGLCVVVSPLMALMYDQVSNLKKRGIEAYAVTSAMQHREMDRVLDNCVYGHVKFLYVSPERLRNEMFLERFKKMNVCMMAVDEAHCISQWGYDFRPSYLLIAEVRQLKPQVPVLALTASATPAVVADIQQRLHFSEVNVIGTSFSRANLSYNVLRTESKETKVLEICRKMPGSAIIYCGTRLRTKEWAALLNHHGIKADAYHAGMSTQERDYAFKRWMRNEVRVMCATNAFGMGIDKPDVRFVLHVDVPTTLEGYFQEAGRAGRDGHKAYAVLIYFDNDIDNLHRQVEQKFPEKEFIRKVYKCLANYLQYAPGAGKDTSNLFNMNEFTNKFELPYGEAMYALQILELAGYLTINDTAFVPSRLCFDVNRQLLYSYQVANPVMDNFIKTILRMYGGTFEQYTNIREDDIARAAKLTVKQTIEKLTLLHKHGILDYQPQTDQPKLTLLTGRMDERNLVFPDEVYEHRKRAELERLQSIVRYLEKKQCRSIQLLEYFGERGTQPCNQCDVCRESNKHGILPQDYEKMNQAIMDIVMKGACTTEKLLEQVSSFPKDAVLEFIRWKLSNEELVLNNKLEVVLPGME
jgi:ATP-dependent DNA helicase RecQ